MALEDEEICDVCKFPLSECICEAEDDEFDDFDEEET
jgi:hypothetical protein